MNINLKKVGKLNTRLFTLQEQKVEGKDADFFIALEEFIVMHEQGPSDYEILSYLKCKYDITPVADDEINFSIKQGELNLALTFNKVGQSIAGETVFELYVLSHDIHFTLTATRAPLKPYERLFDCLQGEFFKTYKPFAVFIVEKKKAKEVNVIKFKHTVWRLTNDQKKALRETK